MTNIERINRKTEHMKKLLSIFEKAKAKMGEEKFEKVMDKLTTKSWEK